LEKPQHFEHIISVDHCIYTIFKYIEAIAPTPYPVLIRGETGVGKELFARAIHNASSVKGEFICVNCAGIDDHFFSDTLFGHVKGAFTGAGASRNGLIEMASQGTLFLDEIGDLSMPSQIKLLRLLQENSYYQLGGETPLQSSARTLAATSVNLEQAVAKGKFRKDLFFRLKAHTVTVPPLRERQQDIPVLLRYFLEKGARQLRKSVPSYSPRLLRFLARYNFPGNVRELEGMVQNALSLHVTGDLDCNPFIDAMDKEQVNFDWKPGDKISHQRLTFPEPLPTIQELEQALASEALKRSQGNKTLAARMLGITRKTLRNKLSQDASNP
jgi:transcriptional regulator with PAS, ATPase and Fis domain